jgi:hypothetical protein
MAYVHVAQLPFELAASQLSWLMKYQLAAGVAAQWPASMAAMWRCEAQSIGVNEK